MKIKAKGLKGFTLIEILIVIALIAILAAITIIAINPQQNFRDARNTQRSSNVNTILSAFTQYTSQQGTTINDFGALPACSATPACIGTGATCIDLSGLSPTYLVSIPTDPSGGTDADTGYEICTEASGRITVSAPSAEGTTISVSR